MTILFWPGRQRDVEPGRGCRGRGPASGRCSLRSPAYTRTKPRVVPANRPGELADRSRLARRRPLAHARLAADPLLAAHFGVSIATSSGVAQAGSYGGPSFARLSVSGWRWRCGRRCRTSRSGRPARTRAASGREEAGPTWRCGSVHAAEPWYAPIARVAPARGRRTRSHEEDTKQNCRSIHVFVVAGPRPPRVALVFAFQALAARPFTPARKTARWSIGSAAAYAWRNASTRERPGRSRRAGTPVDPRLGRTAKGRPSPRPATGGPSPARPPATRPAGGPAATCRTPACRCRRRG